MTKSVDLTSATLDLFKGLAEEAADWSGTPLLDISREERGNLTDLKKRGLLVTFDSDGDTFVRFTDEGVALAASLGIEVRYV